jgi:excisionase family DNA binding protein
MTRQTSSTGALSIESARHYIGGLSRSKFYELVNSGVIRTFRIGRRRYASYKALDDFISERENAEANQAPIGSVS